MRKRFILIILLIAIVPSLFAQKRNYSFDDEQHDTLTSSNNHAGFGFKNSVAINYPIGWFTKFRLQAERFVSSKSSVGLSFSAYGSVPGYQFNTEYRKYFSNQNRWAFAYGVKLGGGNVESPRNTYALIGTSFINRLKLGKKERTYFDFITGIRFAKFVKGRDTSNGLIYAIGPVSFLELNINFGVAF